MIKYASELEPIELGREAYKAIVKAHPNIQMTAGVDEIASQIEWALVAGGIDLDAPFDEPESLAYLKPILLQAPERTEHPDFQRYNEATVNHATRLIRLAGRPPWPSHYVQEAGRMVPDDPIDPEDVVAVGAALGAVRRANEGLRAACVLLVALAIGLAALLAATL